MGNVFEIIFNSWNNIIGLYIVKEIIFYDHVVSEFQLDIELDRKMHSDTC
jgi:hypothetical protein